MGVELELKFAADEKLLHRIGSDFPGGQVFRMESTYYDTPSGQLSLRKYTLRRRLENGISVCTVKTPLSGHGRGEWEVEESDICKAIAKLCASGAPEDLAILTCGGIVPICSASFTRQALLIEKEDFSAELAMDSGTLSGGQCSAPLCEIELEYKSGEKDAFFAFADDFAKTYCLCPEPLSKFRRALNLYLGVK